MQNLIEAEASYVRNAQAIEKDAKTSVEVVSLYQRWGTKYEKDVEAMGYCAHDLIVDSILSYIEKGGDKISMTSRVIDFAAGTGLMGNALRARGFSGQIDAQDGSSSMLEGATSKMGVYSNVFCHFIDPDTAMPEELSNGDYDMATICSGLLPCLIDSKCLKHFVNAVRVGGLISFNIRKPGNIRELEYNIGVEREAFRLESLDVWKLVDLKFYPKYRRGPAELKEAKSRSACVYCYKKLKNF